MKEQKSYIVEPDGMPPKDISHWLRTIHKGHIGKQLSMTVTNERIRSIKQNSWLHKVIDMITQFTRGRAKESGDENYYKINNETTKLWIKQEFLGYEEINGERHLRKTSNLKTFEMNELWENLQIYFAPLDLILPDPNQKDFQ